MTTSSVQGQSTVQLILLPDSDDDNESDKEVGIYSKLHFEPVPKKKKEIVRKERKVKSKSTNDCEEDVVEIIENGAGEVQETSCHKKTKSNRGRKARSQTSKTKEINANSSEVPVVELSSDSNNSTDVLHSKFIYDEKLSSVLNRINNFENQLTESLDDSDDIIECRDYSKLNDIPIKFKYKDRIIKLEMKENCYFGWITKQLANQCGVCAEEIIIRFKGREIDGKKETPQSLQISIVVFLDVDIRQAAPIRVHFVDEVGKGRVGTEGTVFKIQPKESFKRVMQLFADERQVPLKNLRFSFDGDIVTVDQTPQDLDVEDELQIDVKRFNT